MQFNGKQGEFVKSKVFIMQIKLVQSCARLGQAQKFRSGKIIFLCSLALFLPRCLRVARIMKENSVVKSL